MRSSAANALLNLSVCESWLVHVWLGVITLQVLSRASSSLARDVRWAAPIRELRAIRARSGLFRDISELLVRLSHSMLTVLASSCLTYSWALRLTACVCVCVCSGGRLTQFVLTMNVQLISRCSCVLLLCNLCEFVHITGIIPGSRTYVWWCRVTRFIQTQTDSFS